jgi:TrmH family RNA methyltransferase
MPESLLTSRRNPLVLQLRALHQAGGRRQQGLLLLEGTHLMQEALRLQLRPGVVLATPRWLERHPALVAALPAGVAVRLAHDDVLAAAATTQHPDGVLLTVPLPPPPPAPLASHFVLALDRLQDPGNLGTLLRTALAAGVDQVWLADGADPYQPKVLRASAGAALALPLWRLSSEGLVEQLRQARACGLQVAAAVAAGGRPYWQLNWRAPTLLLLGNEGAGLAEPLQALADATVTIPHAPAVESLNVAVAAAPLLLERWRQLQGGAAIDTPG